MKSNNVMQDTILSPKFIDRHIDINDARNILEQFFITKNLVTRIDDIRIIQRDFDHVVLGCTIVNKHHRKIDIRLTIINSEEES